MIKATATAETTAITIGRSVESVRRRTRIIRPGHRRCRLLRCALADGPFDNLQRRIDSGQHSGRCDYIAVIDVPHAVSPLHRRIGPSQSDEAEPVRRSGSALQQPRGGQHFGADTYADQQQRRQSIGNICGLQAQDDHRRRLGRIMHRRRDSIDRYRRGTGIAVV